MRFMLGGASIFLYLAAFAASDCDGLAPAMENVDTIAACAAAGPARDRAALERAMPAADGARDLQLADYQKKMQGGFADLLSEKDADHVRPAAARMAELFRDAANYADQRQLGGGLLLVAMLQGDVVALDKAGLYGAGPRDRVRLLQTLMNDELQKYAQSRKPKPGWARYISGRID